VKWFTNEQLPQKILAGLRILNEDAAWLVRKTGLSRATIDRLLNAEHEPRFTTVSVVADALGWTKDVIEGRVGVPTGHPLADPEPPPAAPAAIRPEVQQKLDAVAKAMGFNPETSQAILDKIKRGDDRAAFDQFLGAAASSEAVLRADERKKRKRRGEE